MLVFVELLYHLIQKTFNKELDVATLLTDKLLSPVKIMKAKLTYMPREHTVLVD